MTKPQSVLEVLEAGAAWLERRGVDAPRRSVEYLIQHVLGMTRLELYMAHDRPLSLEERDALRELVARRGDHEPIAYLMGSWEFYGHELAVDSRVLVPRPETEGLVERALARVPESGCVVDLGTGSGAIAIAMALERPQLEVWAVDASSDALQVAAANVERHGLKDRVRLVCGSWWDALTDAPRFDLVLSNPPYVDPGRLDLVEDGVRRHEPDLALWTPEGDPGAPYREIAAGGIEHALPGATFLLETGVAADAAAMQAFADAGYENVTVEADLSGHPRYVIARAPDAPRT